MADTTTIQDTINANYGNLHLTFLKERLKIDKDIPRHEWTAPMVNAYHQWLEDRAAKGSSSGVDCGDCVKPTTTPGSGDVVTTTTPEKEEHATETYPPNGRVIPFATRENPPTTDWEDVARKAVDNYFKKNGIPPWEVSEKPKKNKERFDCCDCAWNCFVLETGIKAGGVLNEEGRLRAFIDWLFQPYHPKDN